ncbi:MAG: DUF4255 domain-containing protein [Vicinamibacterales bacterium]
MSNFLSVATATAALSQMLQAVVGPDVPGAHATTIRPDGVASLGHPGVNIFCYQIMPNASWSNNDLPTRRANGDVVQRPQAALTLHYLLTFYGDETKLEPQRVLGSVVRALHAHPTLARDLIRQTILKPAFDFLKTSNLADAQETVRFTPLPLSLEELSKLWSVYFQTQYSLSVAYQASVVLIESDVSALPALPVRARNIYAVTFRQPLVEAVRSAADPDAPIVAESPIVISGKRLWGDVTRVAIGDSELTPPLADVSDTQIQVTLPATLHAGVQGLQVVQPRLIGTPPAPHRGVQSNLAPFVLQPSIAKKNDGTPDIVAQAASLTVKLKPAVTQTQRASIVLNELNTPSNRTARAFSFDAVARNQPGDPPETDTLVFPISGVAAGDYLVRVQVDGAESPLERDPDDTNPVYIGPKVTIP